jgi:hypothetical protein
MTRRLSDPRHALSLFVITKLADAAELIGRAVSVTDATLLDCSHQSGGSLRGP